ncbi:MAG: hypothetical protein QXG67_00775 [Candidatus Nitrosotenuis sp.]
MVLLVVIVVVEAEAAQIPDGIRNKAKLWALGQGTDNLFYEVLSDLKELGIIKTEIKYGVYFLPSYGTTEFVKISGNTGSYGQSSPVILSVADPIGSRTDYTTPVLRTGVYSTIIPIRHDSLVGAYHVTAFHAGNEISKSSFFVQRAPAIPGWINTMTAWWVDGKTTDDEFISAIEFLIEQNVLVVVGQTEPQKLSVFITGAKAIRLGTSQSIQVHVTDAHGPAEGALVIVRIEDHSEHVFDEFEGQTDDDGNFAVSWRPPRDLPNLKTFVVYADATDGFSSNTGVFSFLVYCLCGERDCMCRP